MGLSEGFYLGLFMQTCLMTNVFIIERVIPGE
jgi:hypothetical protein